jgi:hypothetical protein
VAVAYAKARTSKKGVSMNVKTAKTKTAPKPATTKRKPEKRTPGGQPGNQNAIGNEGGRPRVYSDPIEFDALVDAYFTDCELNKKKPTLTGISLFLGFCDKETFGTYDAVSAEFSRTVNKARMRIEENRHQLLVAKDTFTPGIIFDLKNNHGWKDKTETEHGLTGDMQSFLAQIGTQPRLARGND